MREVKIHLPIHLKWDEKCRTSYAEKSNCIFINELVMQAKYQKTKAKQNSPLK